MANGNGIIVGIVIAAIILLIIMFGIPGYKPNNLASAYAPTTSSYDFQYRYAPTVYDAGAGQGYQQVYPANLQIGTDYSLPNANAPVGIPYQLGNYIQVLRTQG